MALLEKAKLTRREKDLRHEINHLRKQLAEISQSVAEMGHGVYVDASADARELFKGFGKKRHKVAKHLHRHERDVTRLAKAYPFTFASAAAGVGLLAAAMIAWWMERDS